MPYADPIVRKAFLASYYQKHKSKLKARIALWKKRHPDKVIDQVRRYRKKHPDKYREFGRMRQVHPYTKEEAAKIVKWEVEWRSKESVNCFWCQESFDPNACHTDHIMPLSKGGKHTMGNVTIACQNCNQRKHAKHPTDWIFQLNREIGREVDVLWC